MQRFRVVRMVDQPGCQHRFGLLWLARFDQHAEGLPRQLTDRVFGQAVTQLFDGPVDAFGLAQHLRPQFQTQDFVNFRRFVCDSHGFLGIPTAQIQLHQAGVCQTVIRLRR